MPSILSILRTRSKPLASAATPQMRGSVASRRLISSSAARLVAVVCALAAASVAFAQADKSASEFPDSRADVYAGYAYFHPLNSGINGFQFKDLSSPNATVSVTGWFNHYVGLQIEGAYFSGNGEHTFAGPCSGATCNQLLYTAEAGPTLRLPLGSFVPFIHTLGGGVRMNGPADQHLWWGWGVTGGAGLDYIVPGFNKRLAIRPIQADFQYSQVVYGPLVLPSGTTGGFGEVDALKFSAGILFRVGEEADKRGVMLGCSAEPVSIYPGDAVHITGSTLFIDSKKPVNFSWQTNAGKIIPSGGTAVVDTTGLAPGEYVVSGHVAQGYRARQQASCTTPFVVKPFEPPTLTCSANPATTTSGTTVDINTVGTSPSNRPLSYSYTTTAGQIMSNGPTARLATPGLGAGTITVTCNVTDDLGKSASATTVVTVTAPSLPVIPQTQQLCSLSFERDRGRPVRVDNESKACLDDIALTLGQRTDARLVMVGNTSPDEHPEAAAERALNAKQYMTEEKGIDPARIELRLGTTAGRSLNDVLVPAGATFNETNTELFDEGSIKRHGQPYGKPHANLPPAWTPHPSRRATHSVAKPSPSGPTTP